MHALIALTAGVLLTAMLEAPPQPAPKPAPTKQSTPKQPAEDPHLETAVTLLGANSDNDTLTAAVPSGPLRRGLLFQVEEPIPDPRGQLTITDLEATSTPPHVVRSMLAGADASRNASSQAPLPVTLAAPGLLTVTVTTTADSLRPATTYKGWLLLTAAAQTHRWELVFTTPARGVIVADAVGTLQFVTWPGRPGATGDIPITVRDKSGTGPYHNLRVYFEPASASASTTIKPNLVLDHFSFHVADAGAGSTRTERPVDLRGDHSNITLDKQRYLKARVTGLGPGEYSGALRFSADAAADDASDSRLALTLHVRHHWLLPVACLLLGSIVGWYTTKYVVAWRKTRELARKVDGFRERAGHLARHETARNGWSFSHESTSFGLARLRVGLNQLAQLTTSAIPVLVHEAEITERQQDAETRLSKIEALRGTRVRIEPLADGRPAVQLALGRLLRRATRLIEQPTLSAALQTEFGGLLQSAEAWATDPDLVQYRQALLSRRGSREIPDATMIAALPAGVVRQQLLALVQRCPTADVLADPALNAAALRAHDQLLGRFALLWRERDETWGTDLAQADAAGEPLPALFALIDDRFWEHLKHQPFEIQRVTTSEEPVTVDDLVELRLTSRVPDLSRRMLFHPLRIVWHIVRPDGQVSSVDTDSMTLVQHCTAPGTYRVSAVLQWLNDQIAIPGEFPFAVAGSSQYRLRRLFRFGAVELSVFAAAITFAIATAMSTQYDATFGSFAQYLALFVWAAGAASGGNMFKQLSATSTAGGQADSALPAKE